MSGGHFDYDQDRILERADEIAALIKDNNTPDDWGYTHSYTPDTLAKFSEAEATLRKAAVMLRRVDWLVSGDDGEESFHRRWDEEIKSLAIENVGG